MAKKITEVIEIATELVKTTLYKRANLVPMALVPV